MKRNAETSVNTAVAVAARSCKHVYNECQQMKEDIRDIVYIDQTSTQIGIKDNKKNKDKE